MHTWGFALSAQLLATRLGVPYGEMHVIRNGSGRVTALELGHISISGDRVMQLLHLRSTWFELGELTLDGARASVVYGHEAALLASARGTGGAQLQELTGHGWVTLRHVRTTGRVFVAPRAYTIYRLSVGTVRGPEVGIGVSPLVHARLASPTLLTGRVEPRPNGAVTVSRFVAGGWKVVAYPRLDARGIFRTPLRLRPGGYRIDVAGDGRLAPSTRRVRVTSRILASLHH